MISIDVFAVNHVWKRSGTEHKTEIGLGEDLGICDFIPMMGGESVKMGCWKRRREEQSEK